MTSMCSYMEHQEELYIEQHPCMQEMVMRISCNQFAISIGIEYYAMLFVFSFCSMPSLYMKD